MTLKDCYEALEANYDDVISRLMTEQRIEKYLRKFVEDDCFDSLCRAMNDGNYEDAFRAAHSFKGICMNLGLDRLADSSSLLTENLRKGNADSETQTLFVQMKDSYRDTARVLQLFLDM